MDTCAVIDGSHQVDHRLAAWCRQCRTTWGRSLVPQFKDYGLSHACRLARYLRTSAPRSSTSSSRKVSADQAPLPCSSQGA